MLFSSRTVDPIASAVSFLAEFCAPPWTLAAWRRGRWQETKLCRTKPEAREFISKHSGRMIRFLLGYSRLPLTNAPNPGDLLLSCGIAVAIPIAKRTKLPVPPAVWIEGPDHGIAAWRYLVPVHAAVARRKAEEFAARFAAAERCRCDPLPLMIPLPGARFSLVFQRKVEGIIDALTLDNPETRRPRPAKIDADGAFIRGDHAQVAMNELPVIKQGWMPGDALTLFIGKEKMGKSLAVAKFASYITSGGSWEPGGWRRGWWDGEPVKPEVRGSVIICEEEDPRLQTIARLMAAGCDMTKVHVRVMVPDVSIPSQLKSVTKLAEDLGDCRMISFSPLLSAIPSRDYNEGVVRGKIRPIQHWVRGRRIAIIGVIHTGMDGKATVGSAVIARVCRSGLSFEDRADNSDQRVMRVSLSNVGKIGVTAPYRIEGASVVIDGVSIDTARIIFK